jgi:4-hydroxybenzoate polyprenyltransferase
MAMHAYSAIPDIKADTQAKLQTTATVLGKN